LFGDYTNAQVWRVAMTRLFHVVAATLFLLAAWAGLAPKPPTTTGEPKAQLIQMLGKAGLEYQREQPIFEGGSVLSFKLATCPSDIQLVYFPALSRITALQLARMRDAETTVTFIHDGEIIAGLGTLDLMPRWFWRKLLAALRLRTFEPWQSIALALLTPRKCEMPPIGWPALRRSQ
jgi:hypothetical protein